MENTPDAKTSQPPETVSRFPSQVLAQNVRVIRRVWDLSQADLAERMANLGHGWARQTVGEVERSRRGVSVDELLGLAMALQTSAVTLLDPSAMRDQDEPPLTDIGLPEPVTVRELFVIIAGVFGEPPLPFADRGIKTQAIKWSGNEQTPHNSEDE